MNETMVAYISVFHNEQTDEDGRLLGMDRGYEHGDKMEVVYTFQSNFENVPQVHRSDSNICEYFYQEFNIGETSQHAVEYRSSGNRSLSKGDGVKIVRRFYNPETDQMDSDTHYYVVERFGWLEVIPWGGPKVEGRVSPRQRAVLQNIPTRENRVTTHRTKINLALTRVKDSNGETVTGRYIYQSYTVQGVLRHRAYDKYDFEYWVIEDSTGLEVGRTQTLRDAKYWLAQS